MDQQYWHEAATEWLQTLPQQTWRRHSDRVNARLVGRWLPTTRLSCLLKTDAFDEAVSAGLFPQLAERAATVIAIDISSAALAAAALKYRDLAVVAADVRRLPFVDGSLNAVVSLSSLDHFQTFDELAASLRELYRVLPPGGELILTLDNLMNPLVALRNALPFSLMNRLGIVPYRIGRTAGPRRLQELLEKTGFTVKEMGAVLHVPRVFVVALANLVDRLGSDAIRRGFLGFLLGFERLARWPTCYLTGYFVAVRARRPSGGTST